MCWIMRNILRIVFVLLFVVVVLSGIFTTELFAQTSNTIKVSGYNLNRSASALLNDAGAPLVHPAGPNVSSTTIGGYLLNSSNFGPGGIVECPVEFISPTNYISNGSLVDSSGILLMDVFFATNTTQDLTAEEIDEFKKFLNAGGIIYVHTVSSGGDQYVPLFDELGLDVGFGERQQVSTGSLTSHPNDNTPTTSGPFGPVGPLSHGPFREIISTGVELIAYNPSNNKFVLVDTPVGVNGGYLSISGSPLQANIIALTNNMKYFGNLVSLGCRDGEPMKVLDVPSLKQGLLPFDGSDVYWEDDEYDDAQKVPLQSMWCGRNIGKCGCALTSAAMVMKYLGVERDPYTNTLDPFYLNDYFKKESTKHFDKNGNPFYSSFGFYWGNFLFERVDEFSRHAFIENENTFPQPKLDQVVRESYDPVKLKAYIDQQNPLPVILRVASPTISNHFVVVKGYKGDKFIINDPAHLDPTPGTFVTLDTYGYTSKGDKPMITYKTTDSDFSGLLIVSPYDTRVLVTDMTDPLKPKTGYDIGLGLVLEEISDSYYTYDNAYVDPTGENPTPPDSAGIYILMIKTPNPGSYEVKVYGEGGSQYNFTIYASNKEGNTQINTFEGKVQDNNTYSFNYGPESADETLSQVIPIKVSKAFVSGGKRGKGQFVIDAKIFPGNLNGNFSELLKGEVKLKFSGFEHTIPKGSFRVYGRVGKRTYYYSGLDNKILVTMKENGDLWIMGSGVYLGELNLATPIPFKIDMGFVEAKTNIQCNSKGIFRYL